MKITATSKRVEEILKEKADYEAREEARKARRAESDRRYRQAEDDLFTPIEKIIEKALARFNLLQFEITVRRNFGDSIEVSIRCNETAKFSDSSALSWNYDILLNSDGEMKRETNSWSGLKATTPEQLDSLRQTLGALDVINSMDWEDVLGKALANFPKYSDYYDSADAVREPRPDFEEQLIEAELEDIVGKNIVVKVKPFESGWYRGDEWIQIVRETPKQYEIRQWTAGSYYAKTIKDEIRKDIDRGSVTVRVAKKNIVPVMPLETMEV